MLTLSLTHSTHAQKQTKPHTARQRMRASPGPAGASGKAAGCGGRKGCREERGGLWGDGEEGGETRGEECVLCRCFLSYRRSIRALQHHCPVCHSWPQCKVSFPSTGFILQTVCWHVNTRANTGRTSIMSQGLYCTWSFIEIWMCPQRHTLASRNTYTRSQDKLQHIAHGLEQTKP